MPFDNCAVLVTGASRGIGRAVARAFAAEGASVAVHFNRNQEAAEETLSLLAGDGHIIIQADLTDPEAAEFMIRSAASDLGRLDIVVNNAGIFENHPLMQVSYSEWQDFWQRTIAANLMGPANIMYCAARHMAENGGGRIINISSRGAFRGEPDMPAYGASKAGLNALSQSLAKSLAPQKIYVYAVAPGWVETEMTKDALNSPAGDAIKNESPFGRVARPDEVAHTVLFLASEGSEFLTGGIIDVNGASYLRS